MSHLFYFKKDRAFEIDVNEKLSDPHGIFFVKRS